MIFLIFADVVSKYVLQNRFTVFDSIASYGGKRRVVLHL